MDLNATSVPRADFTALPASFGVALPRQGGRSALQHNGSSTHARGGRMAALGRYDVTDTITLPISVGPLPHRHPV